MIGHWSHRIEGWIPYLGVWQDRSWKFDLDIFIQLLGEKETLSSVLDVSRTGIGLIILQLCAEKDDSSRVKSISILNNKKNAYFI